MDAVDEVKSRLSIEDVVSEYVQLKRAGRNWRGLSPFTNEKTPSFIVSPEKQIWHDFSSGKGGNMFSFVMEVEGLDFKATLELLARKAGIDIEQFRSSSQRNGPNKERLYQLLDLSAKFYQAQLKNSKTTLDYVLNKRKFSKQTILEWRLGYAPNTGAALVSFLKKKGFNEAEMRSAGISTRRAGGLQDMFRSRLMIPLQDGQGQIIGFTARLLAENPDAPKYINTPQTVLYDKSRHVYGLHLAKEAIRQNQFVVLVEGNLDVIASHQAGVRQVVATAGTALTESHLKALSRFTADIRLCFDADGAGQAATERAIPIASRAKVSLSIITLPSGNDPDELIGQDKAKWAEIINQHDYALDWLMTRYQGILKIDSAEGKRHYSDILLPVVQALSDPVEQDHYLNVMAHTIDVGIEALRAKLNQTSSEPRVARKRWVKPNRLSVDKQAVEDKKTEDHFLALMLMMPALRFCVAIIEPEMLFTDAAKELLGLLKTKSDFTAKAEQAQQLQPIAEYSKILSLQYEELYQGLELSELRYEAARLQARLVDQFVKTQKQNLALQLETANETETKALLGKVKQYDLLLNQVQGVKNGQETS
ncbi:MAG TPA: DNA primase [Candidatus Dormibacteraeota bacterium]|nr:DNA primase [Candidatus Dormibacteraeota bacterium]